MGGGGDAQSGNAAQVDFTGTTELKNKTHSPGPGPSPVFQTLDLNPVKITIIAAGF